MSYSIDEKLEIFQEYVRSVKLESTMFVYKDTTPSDTIDLINFSSKPEAIAVLKVLWVFTKLKI